jgi:hypothetical protein
MAEGDTLSVLVLWLDYWILCRRLAVAAEEQGGVEDALALWKMSAAYADAAYEAARMRVVAITLDQVAKPVAEMCEGARAVLVSKVIKWFKRWENGLVWRHPITG